MKDPLQDASPAPRPGPAKAARLHARLTDEPLSVDAAHGFCADAAAGAVVVFTGVVREETDGRAVTALDYEAYGERAQAQLHALAAETALRWPAIAVWVEHRTGTLAIGEASVVVAVSCGHRGEAFDACRWGIDTLKATVSIWKREHWSDGGAHWPGTD